MSGITVTSFILLALCLYSVSGLHILSKRQISTSGLTDAVSGAESDVTGAIGNVGDTADEETEQLSAVPDDLSGLESGVEGDLDNVDEEAQSVTGDVNGISEDLVNQIEALENGISSLQEQLQTLEESLLNAVNGAEGDLPAGTGSTSGAASV